MHLLRHDAFAHQAVNELDEGIKAARFQAREERREERFEEGWRRGIGMIAIRVASGWRPNEEKRSVSSAAVAFRRA